MYGHRCLASVDEITSNGTESGHFALKLTAYISTELMEKCSLAQDRFVSDILQTRLDTEDNSVLTEGQLAENLAN